MKEKEAAKAQKKVQREKQKRSEKAYSEWLADKSKRHAVSVQRERSAQNERVKEVEKVKL